MDNIREFIDRQSWIFAKTYANKAPHEYIVRNNINGTNMEFMDMVDHIQKYGQTMWFWNTPNRYLYLDGKYYWVMTDHMEKEGDKMILDYTDPTIIINRSDSKDYLVSIRWKGLPK